MKKQESLTTAVATPKKKPLKNIKKLVKEEVGEFSRELKRINDLTENTNKLAAYVILILVVMVATMLLMVWNMVIDANNRKIDSTNELIRILNEQKFTTK